MKTPRKSSHWYLFLELIQTIVSLDKFAAHDIQHTAKLNLLLVPWTAFLQKQNGVNSCTAETGPVLFYY
jgi:hypothetical protein